MLLAWRATPAVRGVLHRAQDVRAVTCGALRKRLGFNNFPNQNLDRVRRMSQKANDIGVELRNKLAEIEQAHSFKAADAVEMLQSLLRAWEAYKAGDAKACIEHFGASVQHDSPLQVHPRCDADFYKFLIKALQQAQELGVAVEMAAAATAQLCVSDPRVLGLSDAEAGARLDTLAGLLQGSWWVQYCQATWRVRHGDHRKAGEALTRAILAGGPCGLYAMRARVYSYLEKPEQSERDFRKFLELAPPGHHSVPDAHYALAINAAAAKDMAEARRQYAEGELAEAQVAPWTPYKDSEIKSMAHLFLNS